VIYRDLRVALEWFKEEWQTDLPEKLHEASVHVSELDHLGGPSMTERFLHYLDSGVLWVGDEVWRLERAHGRLRQVLTDMARGSFIERRAARFLFVLACQDFDPERAGMAMTPRLTSDYSPYYTEKVIARLRERMEQAEERRHQPWQMTGEYRELDRQREEAAVA